MRLISKFLKFLVILSIIEIQLPISYNFNALNNSYKVDQKSLDLLLNSDIPSIPRNISTDELVLTADSTINREFVYTNKLTTYYTGNTKKINTRHWHGLVTHHTKFLENFYLKLGNTSSELVLNEKSFMFAYVYPDRLVRKYNIAGIYHPLEEIFMPDYLDGIGIHYSMNYFGLAIMYIQFDVHDIYGTAGSYYFGWDVINSCFWVKNSGSNYYIVFKSNISLSFTEEQYWPYNEYPLDKDRGEDGNAYVFQPGYLSFSIPANGNIYFAFGIADSISKANDIAQQIILNYNNLLESKRDRLNKLISQTAVETSNNEFNKALAWAKISLDNLIMQQYVGGNPVGKGIWAGLHWFPESWSRDLFISFPGATLCTGSFDIANEIINMMSNLQDTNISSITYGRIPNRILPGDPNPAYSSADGTPWFIREIYEYFQYTNNLTFLEENWNVIERAIDGEISKRSDFLNFIVHGPTLTGHLVETWMDGAVWIDSELVANSPRDNRAVEIQALWYTAIKNGAELALLTNHSQKAQSWNEFIETLKNNFNKYYYNESIGYLIDHLNPDGSEDHRIRPNQLFAISVPWDDFINETIEKNVLDTVEQYLVFPHGIATLNKEDIYNWTEDVGYRGYDYGGLSDSECFKDPNGHWVGNSWSYHNGMVWPWLSGPAITAFMKHARIDISYNLTKFLTNLLLYRGTLGSICEVLPGDEDRPTGTTSQAWSLAEYIRTFYQNYLGIQPKSLNYEIKLTPHIPKELYNISSIIKIKNESVHYAINNFFNPNLSKYSIEQIYFRPLQNNTTLNNFQLAISIKRNYKEIDLNKHSIEFYLNGVNITNQFKFETHLYGYEWKLNISLSSKNEFILDIVIKDKIETSATIQPQKFDSMNFLIISLTLFIITLISYVLIILLNKIKTKKKTYSRKIISQIKQLIIPKIGVEKSKEIIDKSDIYINELKQFDFSDAEIYKIQQILGIKSLEDFNLLKMYFDKNKVSIIDYLIALNNNTSD